MFICNQNILKFEREKIYSNLKPETVRSSMSTQECLQLLDPHITVILVIYSFTLEAFQLCQEENWKCLE